MATQALIGISGWRYAPWRGEFYPPGLPARDELKYAAELFPTIELNARRHDERAKGRAYLRVAQDRELRHALEVRHPSFATPTLIGLLREHGIALVVADTAGRWPLHEDVTTDFVPVRLHGDVTRTTR